LWLMSRGNAESLTRVTTIIENKIMRLVLDRDDEDISDLKPDI
jgi:hypothetical protein